MPERTGTTPGMSLRPSSTAIVTRPRNSVSRGKAGSTERGAKRTSVTTTGATSASAAGASLRCSAPQPMNTDANPPSTWRRRLNTLGRWLRRGVALAVAAGLVGGAFGWRWFDTEILSTLPASLGRDTEFRIPCSVQVYDHAGARVDQFYLERRVWVPLAELPPFVWQAFIAAEDKRFFEHEGVDPLGIARALVVNLRGGSTSQGGSTITQ